MLAHGRDNRLPSVVVALSLCWLFAPPAWARSPQTDPLAGLDRSIAAAEASLRDNETQLAESRYRTAIAEGWMVTAALDAADGSLGDARDAVRRATESTADYRAAGQMLAMLHLQLGEADEAVRVLTPLVANDAADSQLRRLLAQALSAAGKVAEAVQTLEEAHSAAPDDAELAFQLAAGYVRLKRFDAAERTFGRIAAARPIPETWILIGRTYRDAGEYDRARAAFEAALGRNPKVRRAHYYLGTIIVMSEARLRMAEAVAQFRQELALDPKDPVTNVALGMALLLSHREAEALPPLELATRSTEVPGGAFYYLGRCLLALDRPEEAATALRRALELSQADGTGSIERKNIHYQLGVALRNLGRTDEAASHFAEAERSYAANAERDRERLSRYLADLPDRSTAMAGAPTAADASPMSKLPREQRDALRGRVRTALARAYLNLGIVQARAGRFARASGFLESAAAVDADFPRVQYTLGVVYFNAQQYEQAAGPLARALAAAPQDDEVRRMLALSWLNTEQYSKAADLLEKDPKRDADASLQYAYGLALARSERAAEAEGIFTRLLAEHADSAELHVLLGEAHAQQNDLAAAIQSMQRALQLKPDVAGANATLGIIYLKQGRLPEAANALRTELKFHGDDLRARQALATVLDLDGDSAGALVVLRSILKAHPSYANARYLLGKILLSQGDASEAAAHLEQAARLAPEDANIHYQLGQAYQKLGRAEAAEQQFELFRRIKDKQRGRHR
jgi:tetratricopeptide (TPR) repeat protein